MKKIFILAIAILCCVAAVNADQLVTTGDEIIECEIKIIKDNSVVFRKPGESFDREMDRLNIFKVRFNNGTEEILFTGVTSQNTDPGIGTAKQTQYKGHDIIESEPDWSAFPPASNVYKIGDWYNENGVEGIVIWTTEDGRHGKLLFPKNLNITTWGHSRKFFTGSKDFSLGLNDYANGYANWQRIKYLIDNDPNYTIEMFPLYEYLNNEAPGWYLPSIKELEYLDELFRKETNYNGKKTKWGKVLPNIAKDKGGDKLKFVRIQSSTETLYVEVEASLFTAPKSTQHYGMLWYDPFNDKDKHYHQHDINGTAVCFMMRHF